MADTEQREKDKKLIRHYLSWLLALKLEDKAKGAFTEEHSIEDYFNYVDEQNDKSKPSQ
jgi:hypothetical protein